MHNHCHPANSPMRAPAGPGACYLWDDGSTGNPRTVTPLQSAQYSVTVLDAQLRPAIRRYNVEVVRIQAELIAALAPGDFCGAGPVTLRVEGALPHYTYLWSTGETTPEFQVPLSGMAPAYRVTITDARQDGAGNTVACAQVLELRAPEVLAAVEEQQYNLLYSRLEALGFEARQVKILEPVQAIAPRSSASATCNVTDNTDFSVEWYDETLDPSGILCSEMAEMEGVTQGFIFASDDICTEADLAEVEALINDETLLHVYLKPCGGEEYGVLMERGVQPSKGGIQILNSWVINYKPATLKLIAISARNPPNTEDLECETDADCDGILYECMTRKVTLSSTGNQHIQTISENDLWGYMDRLMGFFSFGELDEITKEYIARYKQNSKADYANLKLAEIVRKSPEMRSYILEVGKKINDGLQTNGGEISKIEIIDMNPIHPVFGGTYNIINGLTILINDTESTYTRYVKNFKIDKVTGVWSGDFYFELTDHFGLDKGDVLKFQGRHAGFAAWWVLQHRKGYCPFKTKIRIMATIQGKIKIQA